MLVQRVNTEGGERGTKQSMDPEEQLGKVEAKAVLEEKSGKGRLGQKTHTALETKGSLCVW